MHLCLADYPSAPQQMVSSRRATFVATFAAELSSDDSALADSVLQQRDLEFECELPGGLIHADLFRDNALFEGDTLSGVIDFYYAHLGPWIYDLAVTLCDWCYMPGKDFDLKLAQALLNGYQSVRKLKHEERAAWTEAVEAAAARFWFSRLKDQCCPRSGTLTQIKDPTPFRELLIWSRQHHNSLVAALG